MEFSEHPRITLFPKIFEQKTGFDSIRQHIAEACLSDLGRYYVQRMQPVKDPDTIARFQGQTMEFREVLSRFSTFPTAHYADIRPQLAELHIEGIYITPQVLLLLLRALRTIDAILQFFKNADTEVFPLLIRLASAYSFDRSLIKKAEALIDDNGEISDSASPLIGTLRRERLRLLSGREKKLTQIYNAWLKEGYASDTGTTIRNGRMVIPVAAAYKRQVNGFICDASATGQTVYIEPAALIEINNDIAENENEEKKEIIRILTQFTAELRPSLDDVLQCFSFLGTIDFIRAKAVFSASIGGIFPKLHTRPLMDWQEARHPLLMLRNRATPEKVVPMNLQLNESQRIIIISGPNSGGKSVCLKTAGLLQYMLQCGIPVPMAPHSECGIFSSIFIEIGDEQSLENDLSTYSSHLKNMAYFTTHCNSRTLFLIDEMGSGTEPQMGGAIAEAVVEELHAKGAYGVLTTHYTNLKMLPSRLQGVSGGAMLFDTGKLEPLYILKTGEQGSSFAFEIARKTGLSAAIVSKARQKLDAGITGIEDYYIKVRAQDKELQEKLSRFDASDALLNETYQKYKALLDALETEKKSYIAQAKAEAKQLVENANKRIEHVIKTIRESAADKETTREARAGLLAFKEEIQSPETATEKIQAPEAQSPKKPKKKKPVQTGATYTAEAADSPLNAGDFVVMEGQSEVGQLQSLKGTDAEVAFGAVKVKTKIAKLRKVSHVKVSKKPSGVGMDIINAITEKKKHFSATLDLRGQRAEEALKQLDNYIHDAVLCGVSPVNILHGKGEGILRQIIRQALSRNPFVVRFGDAHVEFGGAGITVVEI